MAQYMFIELRHLRPVLIWMVYTLSAIGIFCVLWSVLPERKLYDWYSSDKKFVDEFEWDDIYMTIMFLLTAILNCLVIVLTTFVRRICTK